ncbi:MAG TPA: hypothetical protein VNG33_09975, partial [Polyangiaceae bacterium]|nr:hypothetical protein [Polyangiaceae bacterium]
MNGRYLALGGCALALLITPYLACSSHGGTGDPGRSEADMGAAAIGTWQGSAEIDGETVPFSLGLQLAPRRSAAAHGLSVVGTLTSENPDLNGALDGVVTAEIDDEGLDVALRLEDGKIFSGRVEHSVLTDGHI